MNLPAHGLRDRRLRALGVEPLRLRARVAGASVAAPVPPQRAPKAASAITSRPPAAIRRLALQPDPTALDDPAIAKMYASLTEAVGRAGLQCIRVCDVPDDPGAAVMVFGQASAPAGVPAVRVLRADALAVLHADRSRKRALWERLQALGRGAA